MEETASRSHWEMPDREAGGDGTGRSEAELHRQPVVKDHSERADPTRCVVAHINYLFFQSTQSFLYFYLSHFRRIRPICLTRTPESALISHDTPRDLAGDLYRYGDNADDGNPVARTRLWRMGLRLRLALAHAPPWLAEPMLGVLHRVVVPRLRPEANAERFLAWAERIVRDRGVQILHAAFGPVGWALLPLKRRSGLPLVVTFLGDDLVTKLDPWWEWWIRRGSERPDWPRCLRELLDEGDLFLAEGPFLRQRLIDLGCAPEKVRVQRIGIPVRTMTPRARRASQGGRTRLLFAGRLCEQKGLLDALEAVRLLRERGRDVELGIVGDDTLTDGRYASLVYDYIRTHRLGDRVVLHGFLNHAEYLRELRQADIFVHPSVVGQNGISEGGAPTTILEAQALGIPVVATTHCDIPYVTVAGESAVLVPEGDAPALAAALGTLLDHPERWDAMGAAGRRHVERHHDIEREVRLLEDRYFTLLGAEAAAPPRP